MFDTITDVGLDRFKNLELRQGPDFPANPVVGLLFMHETHGMVVYCHDLQWRKVQVTYENSGA